MRITISIESATMNDLRALAKFNKRSISNEISISVERWLLMNRAIVVAAKSKKPLKKCQG